MFQKKSTEQGGDFIMDCCHQKRIRVCWSFCCHCPGLPLLVNNTLFLWVEHMLRPCAHCSEREMGDIMRHCAQWWTRGQGSYRAAREQHMDLLKMPRDWRHIWLLLVFPRGRSLSYHPPCPRPSEPWFAFSLSTHGGSSFLIWFQLVRAAQYEQSAAS